MAVRNCRFVFRIKWQKLLNFWLRNMLTNSRNYSHRDCLCHFLCLFGCEWENFKWKWRSNYSRMARERPNSKFSQAISLLFGWTFLQLFLSFFFVYFFLWWKFLAPSEAQARNKSFENDGQITYRVELIMCNIFTSNASRDKSHKHRYFVIFAKEPGLSSGIKTVLTDDLLLTIQKLKNRQNESWWYSPFSDPMPEKHPATTKSQFDYVGWYFEWKNKKKKKKQHPPAREKEILMDGFLSSNDGTAFDKAMRMAMPHCQWQWRQQQ